MSDEKKLTVKDVKKLSAALDVLYGKPPYATMPPRTVAVTGHPPEPIALSGHSQVDAPSETSDPVGYKNPPAATQWKPGQSGNPNGRPKTESLGEIFRRIASGPAESRKTGQPIDTEMGHMIRRLFTRTGSYCNPAEARLLLALAQEFLPERQGDESQIIDMSSIAVETEPNDES